MKRFSTKPPNGKTTPDVETLLRASAAWEPDAPPPSDFAAFTRNALQKRKPSKAAFVPLPLAVALASVCILWAGGRLHVPREAVTNAEAAPVSFAVPAARPAAPASLLAVRSFKLPASMGAVHRASAANVARTTAPRRRHHSAGRLRDRETIAAHKPSGRNAVSAAMWETETVARPAWGALVPVPPSYADCALPPVNEPTGDAVSPPPEGEASSEALPLVLDVALPDMETPMFAPSPTPSPSPSK